MARQSAHARWGSPSPERAAEIAAARRQVNDAIAHLAAAPLHEDAGHDIRRRLDAPDLRQARETLRAALASDTDSHREPGG